ncbi:hypothetical protein ACA910_004286 [Epithemia clementina (nom. ined.)]
MGAQWYPTVREPVRLSIEAYQRTARAAPNAAARKLSLLSSTSHSDSEELIVSNKNHSNITLNNNMTATIESSNRLSKMDLEYLEQKLNSLTHALDEQRKNYQKQMFILKEQKEMDVKSAQEALESMRSKYLSYKMEMETKLAAVTTTNDEVPTADDIQKMQSEMAALQERAQSQQEQLNAAKAKLADNLEARKALQAEMVALKHGYLHRLTELEDALEHEQDTRVRDQQNANQQLQTVEQQLKQRLRDTIDESRRNLEIMTTDYIQKLAQRQEELTQARRKVRVTQELVQEKEAQIATLQQERLSIRKLLALTVQLLRQRIGQRLTLRRERRRQQRRELEGQHTPEGESYNI